MCRTPVDLARDDIIDLVEGMPSTAPAEHSKAIRGGLRKIIDSRGFDATAEAAGDRIAYWEIVPNKLDDMAGRAEDARVAGSTYVESLRKRAKELREYAEDLRSAMRHIVLERCTLPSA